MVASRQVEISIYRAIGRQRGRGIGVLAKVIGRTAIPILRKYIVPASKRVGADLLEFAAPEIAEVVSGRKNYRTAENSLGRQTLRKQLGSGSRKRTVSRVIPAKSAKQISRSQKDFFTNISHESKADEEAMMTQEEQEASVPVVTRINNILHSIFSNVEVYINNQQI